MTSEQASGVVAFSAGVGDRAGKHKSIMELDHGIAGSSRVATGDHCKRPQENIRWDPGAREAETLLGNYTNHRTYPSSDLDSYLLI